jgi:hypothetical protein
MTNLQIYIPQFKEKIMQAPTTYQINRDYLTTQLNRAEIRWRPSDRDETQSLTKEMKCLINSCIGVSTVDYIGGAVAGQSVLGAVILKECGGRSINHCYAAQMGAAGASVFTIPTYSYKPLDGIQTCLKEKPQPSVKENLIKIGTSSISGGLLSIIGNEIVGHKIPLWIAAATGATGTVTTLIIAIDSTIRLDIEKCKTNDAQDTSVEVEAETELPPTEVQAPNLQAMEPRTPPTGTEPENRTRDWTGFINDLGYQENRTWGQYVGTAPAS